MAIETRPSQSNELPAPPRYTGDAAVDSISSQDYQQTLYEHLTQGADDSGGGRLPRGWIDGLLMANNAGNPNRAIDISAGSARADDDSNDIVGTAILTKRLQGPFAAGDNQPMLDAGINPVASTWYHVFAISNPSSGVMDALASASFEEPTMPEGFTLKRRIGSIKTTAANAIAAFVQFGDEFRWLDPPLDADLTTIGTSAALVTLASVPPGLRVKARLNVFITDAGQTNSLYLSPPDVSDEAPSETVAPLVSFRRQLGVTADFGGEFSTWTNTAQQIRRRAGTASLDTLRIATLGWIDPRGRDAV